MPIFMMFGKYSSEALSGISPQRTAQVVDVIGNHSGNVISKHALLGEHDLVLTTDFPDAGRAMAASMDLHRLTRISFTTSPVVEVEKFHKLVGEAKDI